MLTRYLLLLLGLAWTLFGDPVRALADLPPSPPRYIDPNWGHIEGTVVGQSDGKPRPRVTITVTGPQVVETLTADEKGTYRSGPVPAGRYVLEVKTLFGPFRHPTEVVVADRKTSTVAILVANEPPPAPPSATRPAVAEMKQKWVPCALVQSIRVEQRMDLYFTLRGQARLHVGQEGVILTQGANDDLVRVDEVFTITRVFSAKQFTANIERSRPTKGQDVICLLNPA